MFPGLRLSPTGITAVQFRCDLITNSWLINGIAAPIVEERERSLLYCSEFVMNVVLYFLLCGSLSCAVKKRGVDKEESLTELATALLHLKLRPDEQSGV